MNCPGFACSLSDWERRNRSVAQSLVSRCILINSTNRLILATRAGDLDRSSCEVGSAVFSIAVVRDDEGLGRRRRSRPKNTITVATTPIVLDFEAAPSRSDAFDSW